MCRLLRFYKVMHDDLQFYEGKKVAVVGASGYVGSLLCPRLKTYGAEVVEFSKSNSDITQKTFWEKLFSKPIDIVFHLAAYEARVPDVNLDLQVNAVSVLQCLEAAKNLARKPCVVFSSSSNLAGKADKLPVNENTPDNPMTIYAIHKLLAERYLYHYKINFQIPNITLRLANVYGPSASLELSKRVVLNKLVAMAASGEELKLFANQDKSRDFVYIEDVLNAFLLAGRFAKDAKQKFYVIGSEEGTTFKKCVEIITRSSGKEILVTKSETNLPEVEMREFVADSSAFKKLTGWQVHTHLEEGIKKTFDYFKEKV